MFMHRRNSRPAQQTGSNVIRMTLPPASLFTNLLPRPVQVAKMVGEHNAVQQRSRTRTAAHSKRNLVVNIEADVRNRLPSRVSQNLVIGTHDQDALHVGA